MNTLKAVVLMDTKKGALSASVDTSFVTEGATDVKLLYLKMPLNGPFRRYGSHFDLYCFKRYYGVPPKHPIISF